MELFVLLEKANSNMMKKYIDKLIRLFLASDFSKGPTREIQHWMADGTHNEEKDATLTEVWKNIHVQADASTRYAFGTVCEKIGVMPPRIIPFYKRPVWRYAAVFALLVVSVATTYWATSRYASRETVMAEEYAPMGEIRTIVLPDSSLALLNSDSYILYPKNFEGETRTVYLMGEADFKVRKNLHKPFIVRSGDMAVTALGTEFNVNFYPEDTKLEATLLEGKIKVDCGAESYILAPGEQVVYNRLTGVSGRASVNSADVTAWQRGEVVFRSCTIADVLQTLQRRFGVKFQYKEGMFNTDKFNFSFRSDASIGQIMDIMKTVTGKFDYLIDGNTCFLMESK